MSTGEQQARAGQIGCYFSCSHLAVFLLSLSALPLLLPSPALSYLCGGRSFETVTVSLSYPYAGQSSSYTIATRLPVQAGCGISTDTEIAILLPSGSQAVSTDATVNAVPVNAWVVRDAERVVFRSPVHAGPGSNLVIQLAQVQNPLAAGTKTILLSALTGELNRIGPTVSQPFSVYTGWWPPWQPTPTPKPTPPCGTDLSDGACLPGGGLIRSDCLFQWLAPAPAQGEFHPRRVQKIICYEGDPRCDADPNVADGACTIPVRLCANTTDARLPHCQATDVRQVEFRVSGLRVLRDIVDQQNLQALQLLAGPNGLGVKVTSFGSTIFPGVPQTMPNICTDPAMLRVSLKRSASGQWRRGAKTLRSSALSSWGQVDHDAIKLECRPSTCGNGILETDHESCDDGNRVDGDGCNRGCQLEAGPSPTATRPSTATPTRTPTPMVTRFCPTPRPAPTGPALYIEDLSLDTGGNAEIVIKLATGGRPIAGTQNDIVFDANVRVLPRFDGRPDCTVPPEINKSASTFGFLPTACTTEACTGMRALVFAADNVDPIPDGAVLYRCNAAVVGSGTLSVTNARGLNPDGQAIPEFSGRDGNICVRGTQSPTRTRTPTLTPTPTPTFGEIGDPQPQGCGNGTTEAGEDCDDGGICVGTARAGQACTADAECFTASDVYKGVCLGGPKPETFCQSDGDCAPGRCVACRTFGGDGCAANCTLETTVTYSLVPGVVRPDQTLEPGTSGAVIWGDPLVIGLSLQGSQQLKIGKERNGLMTAVIPAASVQFPQIPISTLACACVRGAEYKTCGGAVFKPDGSFTESCTEGFASEPAVCPPERPCAAAFGPGNSAAGFVGCQGLGGINVSVTQHSCPDPGNPDLNGPVQLSLSGNGGPGSALLVNAIGIGTAIGACQPTFCTDADPPGDRGTPNPLLFTTGEACATVLCKNDDPSYPAEPKCVTGQPVSCPNLSAGNITGLTLGGAFTALGQQTLGDIEVTVRLVAQ